ncbi:MAG TPA: hypothetical protein VF119_04800, partial [Candidatus Limnocylindrales bacterium]
MALELILALIVIAVVANVIVMAFLVVSPMMRGGAGHGAGGAESASDRALAAAAVVGGLEEERTDDGVPTRTYDRVVRIVSWVFLLASTTIVAVSGLWTENQPAILALLALAGLFVLVVHDLLPEDALGTAKFVLEGSVAITVATMLVALTGGVASPFFFTYPLIVGGAALVVPPSITVVVAATAALGYIIAVLLGSPDLAAEPASMAVVGINLTAMFLL